MKRIGKWLLGLITSALTLVLVIVLLPYAAKWVARIMPDANPGTSLANFTIRSRRRSKAFCISFTGSCVPV